MANGIKIGGFSFDALKIGGNDVDAAYIGDTLVYSGSTPPTPHDYSQDYFTVRALESGDFTWSGTSSANCLSYSTDSGNTWSEPSSAITTSTLSSGDTVLWKGSNMTLTSRGIGKFSSTSNFEAEGNIMSLHFGDDFSGQTSLSGLNYGFAHLFSGCTTLTTAENLVLPATTLIDNCYYGMFLGCTSLTETPQLPATSLANACYQGMFRGCTSLTTAPELPVATLAVSCYKSMFSGCTSLTTAPELPTTTLAQQCYNQMFQGCTSLTTAPELPAATLAASCYQSMFNGCTSLNSITCLATTLANSTSSWVRNVAASGTFTKAASMTSWTTGNNGIPSGWTVQDYTS